MREHDVYCCLALVKVPKLRLDSTNLLPNGFDQRR